MAFCNFNYSFNCRNPSVEVSKPAQILCFQIVQIKDYQEMGNLQFMWERDFIWTVKSSISLKTVSRIAF